MKSIFDAFKSDSTKQREAEEQQEIEHIRSKKEVEHEVFDALTREFKVEESSSLRQSASANDPPTAILRNEMQSFSLWYRIPLRGESHAGHVVDYIIFRGTHRIANKTNPDVVIECRQLEPSQSNRLDPRVVKDVIGLSVDLLPAMTVLAVNRELSEYAKGLADAYGIKLVNMNHENSGKELFDLITSDKQTTREKLMRNLERALGKIDTLIVRKAATPWGRKVIEEKQERLKDRVFHELAKAKATPKQLGRALHAHDEFILNELHILERDKKARIIERSMHNDQMENVWAVVPAIKSTK